MLSKIRVSSNRPHAECILKILTLNSTMNIVFRDVEDKIQLLISTPKTENSQTNQGLDSDFFIANHSDLEI